MFIYRSLPASAFLLSLSALSLGAGDLSQYREFDLASSLTELAAQANMSPQDAAVIHQRPALLQELSWRAPSGDSVKNIKFGFYEGELFRMIVNYDGSNTEGLTVEDMKEAISGTYGDSIDARTERITLPTIYDDEPVQVLARWTDPNWSFNLVRSKHAPTFYLVALSAKWYLTAEAANAEALRLDRLDAGAWKSEKSKDACK